MLGVGMPLGAAVFCGSQLLGVSPRAGRESRGWHSRLLFNLQEALERDELLPQRRHLRAKHVRHGSGVVCCSPVAGLPHGTQMALRIRASPMRRAPLWRWPPPPHPHLAGLDSPRSPTLMQTNSEAHQTPSLSSPAPRTPGAAGRPPPPPRLHATTRACAMAHAWTTHHAHAGHTHPQASKPPSGSAATALCP